MRAPSFQYLIEPDASAETYGTLEYDKKQQLYRIRADRHVCEMAARIFPGRRRNGTMSFRATQRMVGDLNWFMLRFPLDIKCREQFERDRQWAIDQAERRLRAQSMPAIHPDSRFNGQLFEYQAKGVGHLVTNQRTLLADDMGLGKTVQAIAAMAAINEWPVLVVAPPPVQRQWARMVETFLNVQGGTLLGDKVHVIRGRKPYELPDVPVYVIHYLLLADWCETLQEMCIPVIVFDEIQELRHGDTRKYSAASLISSAATCVWGLSGTPIYNYGIEMWAICNIIEFHCLGDRESFSREWCTGYGEKVVADPEALGNHLRRDGLMLRRTKDLVQSELPPKRRVTVDVDHDEGLYRRLVAPAVDLARSYDRIAKWSEKGQAAREAENQARQATGVAKAPYVADFVETLVAGGERVLLFAYHHQVHDILTERLEKHGLVRLTGREGPSEKESGVRQFAAGEASIALLSLRSAAGLDGLQGKGTCVVFAELDWSPAIHSQCEDRLHRIGVESESVLCYYMFSSTSFDLVIADVLGLKAGQFFGLMGEKPDVTTESALGEQAAESHMQKIMERLRSAA